LELVGGRAGRRRGVIVGINIIGIEREFVARSLSHGLGVKREASRRGISSCQRQARIKQTAPKVRKFWMRHLLGRHVVGAPATTNFPSAVVILPESFVPSFSVRFRCSVDSIPTIASHCMVTSPAN